MTLHNPRVDNPRSPTSELRLNLVEDLAVDDFDRPDSAVLGTTEGASGDDLEFVEIHNPTSSSVDLTGWRLRKGVDYDFVEDDEPPLLIGAGETIVVVSFNPDNPANNVRVTQFRSSHGIGTEVRLVGGYGGGLRNTGETLELQRPDEPPLAEPDFIPHVVVDRVVYDDAAP